ncbi:Gp49 family protein [Sphingosinicella ginsenosidimutans]|uniref:Gp49 family protein n=1 Tax=Allosphingosinicella ginsenosidimutans TaxID=1176539 RepID=UPI001FB0D902|nr:Gp49 family protein [Sphingosinicella ginsenosidimutans]
MESKIASESYTVIDGVLTLCTIKMKNGFYVTGESAPASPENFNADLGKSSPARTQFASFGSWRDTLSARSWQRPHERAHIMMAGAAFAALAGCATPPAPEPRIVTQTVNVPVRAPCPDPADVPQVPRRWRRNTPKCPPIRTSRAASSPPR